MINRVFLFGFAAIVLSSQAAATVVVYTDRAAWETAVGAFETEDFNFQTPFDFVAGTNDVGLFDIELTAAGSGDINGLLAPTALSGQ